MLRSLYPINIPDRYILNYGSPSIPEAGQAAIVSPGIINLEFFFQQPSNPG
jgi:hypothetical protein